MVPHLSLADLLRDPRAARRLGVALAAAMVSPQYVLGASPETVADFHLRAADAWDVLIAGADAATLRRGMLRMAVVLPPHARGCEIEPVQGHMSESQERLSQVKAILQSRLAQAQELAGLKGASDAAQARRVTDYANERSRCLLKAYQYLAARPPEAPQWAEQMRRHGLPGMAGGHSLFN